VVLFKYLTSQSVWFLQKPPHSFSLEIQSRKKPFSHIRTSEKKYRLLSQWNLIQKKIYSNFSKSKWKTAREFGRVWIRTVQAWAFLNQNSKGHDLKQGFIQKSASTQQSFRANLHKNLQNLLMLIVLPTLRTLVDETKRAEKPFWWIYFSSKMAS